MARTVTRLQLRTWIRQRANFENDQFVTDAELNDLINHALGEFQDILKLVNGDMRLEKESTFSTVNGTRTYALPADFMDVTGVWWDAGTGQLIRMEEYMPVESQDDWQATGWSYFARATYRLQGANIRFVPIPSGVYTVTLKYIPNGTVLAADGDTVDTVNYWDDWLIAHCCAFLLAKQESDPGFWLQERERQRHRILVAAERSMSPQRIQDVKRGQPWPFARRWS